MKTAPKITVLVAAAALAVPSGASASTPTPCGASKPHGITHVKALNVGCATALKVARNHNYAKRTKGWTCKGRRLSSAREKVRCRKGSRTVTFRSTYVMELPAAAAPPSAGSS